MALSYSDLGIYELRAAINKQITDLICDSCIIISDVKGTKELKKSYDKVSDDFYSMLAKYTAMNKLKPNEVSETNLNQTRSCFRSVAMDYVFQVIITTCYSSQIAKCFASCEMLNVETYGSIKLSWYCTLYLIYFIYRTVIVA